MKDTIVVDLDGTLANVAHRRHLVTGKKRNYEAFHALLSKDEVNEPVATLVECMRMGRYHIIIVSARPQSTEFETRKWLSNHDIIYNELRLLRPNGDSTPDQELKMAWLKKYGAERILFVVDDRQKVVNAWRAAGVTCLQCDAWEEGK